MTDGPITLMRRRFARSIDWRVENAVKQALAAQHTESSAAGGLHLDHPDALRRFESLEARSEQLDATIERLRASIASLSVTLTDGQRAQAALLDRLAADVDGLNARVASL